MKFQQNTHFVIDCESDGPMYGVHSMVSFGLVLLEPGLNKTFYGQCRPESNSEWIPDALAVSGHSREETLLFPSPEETMKAAIAWVKENSVERPIFWSDNNGYDKAWWHYYCNRYVGLDNDPFGWSSRRIGDLICGIQDNLRYNWKRERIGEHTHHPQMDALQNAQVLLKYMMNDAKIKK